MKVCLITPLYEPWVIGGAERYAATLANALSNYHEVVVITTKGPTKRVQNKIRSNPNVIEMRIRNVCSLYEYISKISSIGIFKKSLYHILDIWNYSSYRQIKKIMYIEKPNLVHSHVMTGLSSSLFSAIKDSQIPHVYTTHGFELISRWPSLFRKGKPVSNFNIFDRAYISYMRRMSSSLDAVISPSKFLMDFHIKLGYFKKSKSYVVPNGIAIPIDVSPKEDTGNEFLFIGQITEHKGPQVAIKAFKKLKESEPRLHIVGDGPYMDTIKRIANGDKRIFIHGFVKNKTDLNQIFNRCSYVIVPSLWQEIFGLVVIECMSKGLPVLASNTGALPELIKDGYNGFLFGPGDVDSLYLIVKDLINDKRTLSELSKNAIESSKRFSIENHLETIKNIYHQHAR